MTSASRKTPRCIYYDCHAPGHQVITGQFLPFRVGFWWNRNDATTFLRFRRPRFPRRDPGFSFSTVFAEILRRFALGFFSSFFLLLLEFQSWQFYYFSPLFCREDSSIFQENASRSSLSLKFYFSSEKGLRSQLFFFLNIYLSSRVIFSKHPQNFSQLFENLHSSVHTPLPRFFNPPLSTPSASLLHFLTSNFLPDNSLK